MSAEAGILSSSGRRQAAIALMTATAMQAFDTTIANVALPQLEQSLGGGIDLGSWVMTSYLCASAVMATLTGWLRRRYGGRQLFAGAIGLFVFASVLCSIAPSAVALIQFRLIQGMAAGIIQPLAQAILLDIYPQQQHGRMLAIWGATIMAGPILGPLLGGVITDLASWRWIFAVNVPLGFVAIFGLGQVPTMLETTDKARIDSVGIVLLVTGVGSLQLALERSIGQVWPFSAEIMAEIGVAVLALGAIAFRHLRSQFTLFKFQVFRNLNFTTSVFYNFMVGALLFTTIVFLPALSEGPLGYDATQAGLALSPRGVGTMLTMLAVGYLIDRIDHRALIARWLADKRRRANLFFSGAAPRRRDVVGLGERDPGRRCGLIIHSFERARLFDPGTGAADRCGRRIQPDAPARLRNRHCGDDGFAASQNPSQSSCHYQSGNG
jgi:MFS transporter, DHA2 family, multidrug resistance protein